MRQLTVGSVLFVTGGGGEVVVASMDRVEAAARNVDDIGGGVRATAADAERVE